MAVVTMKSLLESGVHFGHQVKRWDPRMKKYIFAERNGIHIIDLQKTIVSIKDAYDAVRKVTSAGKSVLFVGTKKQAQQSIAKEAERCGMYYVNNTVRKLTPRECARMMGFPDSFQIVCSHRRKRTLSLAFPRCLHRNKH